MPWFRLEDSFYANPKVMEAGNAAVGLWVRCSTWSAAQLTDGHIPAHIVTSFGARREADALTTARLWVPCDGEFVIADWLDYQPSALEVKERRKRDAERKRKGRETQARTGRNRDDNGRWADEHD
jgi:hypothetical protein